MDYLQYLNILSATALVLLSFKPYYKWITFNILTGEIFGRWDTFVLNLIINGLPSIYLMNL